MPRSLLLLLFLSAPAALPVASAQQSRPPGAPTQAVEATQAQPAQAAGPAILVRPGAWNVRSGQEGQATAGYQLCLANGTLEDIKLLLPRLSNGSAGNPPTLHAEGGVLVWQFDCPSAALAASGRYTLQAEAIEGRVTIVAGTPPTTRQELLSAQRAGACAAP